MGGIIPMMDVGNEDQGFVTIGIDFSYMVSIIIFNMVVFCIFSRSRIAGRGPKIGERADARSPIFGYSLNFREVLILG